MCSQFLNVQSTALLHGSYKRQKPLEAIPDSSSPLERLSLLRHWHLCQSMVRQFWTRWSAEYMLQIRKYTKWQFPSRNIQIGDLVCIREDSLVPTKWPLARVIEVHQGKDKLVRVATVKTSKGIYTRPIVKLVLIMPHAD